MNGYFKRIAKKIKSNHKEYYSKFDLPILENSFLFIPKQREFDNILFNQALKVAENEKYKDYVIYWVTNSDIKLPSSEYDNKTHNKIKIIIIKDRMYFECLARCKYIISKISLPSYFAKRNGQVLINLWRKKVNNFLDEKDLATFKKHSINQRNFLLSDYIVFPSDKLKNQIIDQFYINSFSDAKLIVDRAFFENNIATSFFDNLADDLKHKMSKHKTLAYVGNLRNKYFNKYIYEKIINITSKEDNDIVVCTTPSINKEKREMIDKIKGFVPILVLPQANLFSITDVILYRLTVHFGLFKKTSKKKLAKYLYKFIPNNIFDEYIDLSGKERPINSVLSCMKCSKTIVLFPEHLIGNNLTSSLYKYRLKHELYLFDKVVDDRKLDVRHYWDEDRETYYNHSFSLWNFFSKFKSDDYKTSLKTFAIVRNYYNIPLSDINILIDQNKYKINLKKIISIKKYNIVKYDLHIPNSDVYDLKIQNRVFVYYKNSDGYGIKKSIIYNVFDRRKGKNRQGKLNLFPDGKTTSYFRQTPKNSLYFTTRKRNYTDSKIKQFELNMIYYLSKLIPLGKKILLYEKESSRYEESASVLFEKLIDNGYKNVFFILDKNYPYIKDIKDKYKKYIIHKGSFKHFLYFYRCKDFLGSESLMHSIDLRISNRHVLDKLARKDINYVFLQHGVMYMISLDAESRNFFTYSENNKGKFRVVVSSKKEMEHFVNLGNYNPKLIYTCGLPKFDRNQWNNGADKIVIMPTWRPWEYNMVIHDFENSNYYKMVYRIFKAIPDEIKDRIIILPHPLFFEVMKDADFELKRYMVKDAKYDFILRDTKVLITDYSSISYDAFYRGANVIFYWEEKDKCLINYGPSAKLMINESNIFGDICYNAKELEKVIRNNYYRGQNTEYVNNYREIVQFHDGKNTDRLIDMLIADKII